jgi:hypothetical protein
MAGMARLRFMMLVELLNAANQGYPDGYLAEYYDTKTGKRKPGSGDGLARFIVLELIDTFDSEATDDSQIGIATQVLERAREDLLGVIQALGDGPDTPRVAK